MIEGLAGRVQDVENGVKLLLADVGVRDAGQLSLKFKLRQNRLNF